jgi:hypothetical protein
MRVSSHRRAESRFARLARSVCRRASRSNALSFASMIAPVMLALSSAGTLLAQRAPTGRLEGTITDSVHARPLAGANVLVLPADSQPSLSFGAATDARGRYAIDTLPVGRYMVEFANAFLDSLEITLPSRAVTIEAGRTSRVDFGVPSRATLRAAACPGLQLPPETGAIVGRALDADAERPLVGATVVTSWTELTADRATMSTRYQERSGAVTTDSVGQYRLCGVPTDSWVLVQLQHAGKIGSPIRLLVPDSVGVVVHELSISLATARSAADSTAPADSVGPPLLSGTASLTGVVRGVGGLPLADAQLRVLGAAPVARSDARGRYALSDLPAGTQVLEVRHIGYLIEHQPVELRTGRTVEQDVHVRRIVTLDSMRVLAQRSRYREFEEHRKHRGFGKFFDEQQIENRHAFDTSDLIRMIPGFRVSGSGLDAQVMSSRGVSSMLGPCSPNIVIDGMQHQEINLINPANIGAMEVYREGEPSPPQYFSRCGAIVIWTKR